MHHILVLQWGRSAAGPTLALTIARALMADDRYAVHVSYSKVAKIAPDLASLQIPQLPVTSWRSARDIPRVLLSLPVILARLARFIRRNRIDTVVIPMEHPLHTAVTWALRALGVRQVLFLHDADLHPGEAGKVRSVVRAAQFRTVDAALVFSEHVRENARAVLRLDDDHVRCTNLPPMLSDGSGSPRALRAGAPLTLGMFGRAVEYKGFDLAVDAVRILRTSRLELRLRLVGKGVSEFVKQTDEPWLEVEDRYLEDDEIPALLGELDLLLLPYREASQSGVLVEAMAVGLPVVVTPVGGLPGQVRVAGCGTVAEAVTAEALATAIEMVTSSPQRYQQYSHDGLAAAAGPQGRGSFVEALSGAIDAAHRDRRQQ